MEIIMNLLLLIADIVMQVFAVAFALLYLFICNFRLDSEIEIKKTIIHKQYHGASCLAFVIAVAINIFAGSNITAALARSSMLLRVMAISWLGVCCVSLVSLILLIIMKPENLRIRIAATRQVIFSSLVIFGIAMVLSWLFS